MKKNNYPKTNNSSESAKKTTIKSCIMVGDDRNSNKIFSYTNNEGETAYSGFYWDIWTIIKAH